MYSGSVIGCRSSLTVGAVGAVSAVDSSRDRKTDSLLLADTGLAFKSRWADPLRPSGRTAPRHRGDSNSAADWQSALGRVGDGWGIVQVKSQAILPSARVYLGMVGECRG